MRTRTQAYAHLVSDAIRLQRTVSGFGAYTVNDLIYEAMVDGVARCRVVLNEGERLKSAYTKARQRYLDTCEVPSWLSDYALDICTRRPPTVNVLELRETSFRSYRQSQARTRQMGSDPSKPTSPQLRGGI